MEPEQSKAMESMRRKTAHTKRDREEKNAANPLPSTILQFVRCSFIVTFYWLTQNSEFFVVVFFIWCNIWNVKWKLV